MANQQPQHIIHPIPPFYTEHSRVLILGSFPSPKSRESKFFYGHPQNRFWKVISALWNEANVPATIEEKADLLRKCNIACWDSIHECDIIGASDASIRNVTPNDLQVILQAADIQEIYCNGKKSWEIYQKYCAPLTGRDAKVLPSTSPANAAWTMPKLLEAWKEVYDICAS